MQTLNIRCLKTSTFKQSLIPLIKYMMNYYPKLILIVSKTCVQFMLTQSFTYVV